MAELVVKSGKHRGRKVRLATGETLVGREKGCPIRLATNDVSRRHCKLVVAAAGDGETVTVEDLGSRNGTFVNDRAVAGVTPLSPGDRLRVGPVLFLLPDPDEASESEVVNWLVPPPAAGTVTDEEPTEGDTVVADDPNAADPAGDAPATLEPAEPPDAQVALAAKIIRERHAAPQ